MAAIIKAELPPEQAERIASALPENLRASREIVNAYPADILDKEDIFYEGEETAAERDTRHNPGINIASTSKNCDFPVAPFPCNIQG